MIYIFYLLFYVKAYNSTSILNFLKCFEVWFGLTFFLCKMTSSDHKRSLDKRKDLTQDISRTSDGWPDQSAAPAVLGCGLSPDNSS